MNRSRMLTAGIAIVIGTLVLPVMAKQTFRDAKGHVQWTAQAEGAKIVYRNAEGKVGGSAQKAPNGKVTYRNAEGIVKGIAQPEPNGKVTYRNGEGKVKGSAQKELNGKVTYRAKDGKVKGSAQIDGSGTTTYRNAQGNVAYVVQGEKTIADMGFIAFKLFE